MFRYLEDRAYEYPFVFVGTRLADPHIRAVLESVEKNGGSRPMYYFVAPNINEHEAALFAKRKITPISATFDDFMNALDAAVSPLSRALASAAASQTHPMQRFFRRSAKVPPSVLALTTNNVDFVHSALASDSIPAEVFYKGVSTSWNAIEMGFDIERQIYSTAMLKTMSLESAPAAVDIVVIRGAAGAGKSVLAHRMAWDLATKYDNMVLFAPPDAKIWPEPLVELYELTGKRSVLIVDQAADQLGSLLSLRDALERLQVPLTLVIVDTQAAFGSDLERFDDSVKFRFEVRPLQESEIRELLQKLDQNRCLGLLKTKSPEERFETFTKLADRQLLVALYEATQGKPLEEILLEEYNRIILTDAQELYLIVCTLNQFRVPVRAGLVQRLTGIRFEDFSRRLLGPLDSIVFASMDRTTRDYVYSARHPNIAEIVFRRVLDTQSKQIGQYLRVLGKMNIAYSSDHEAMRQMINYRNVRTLSSSLAEGRRILAAAEEVTDGDPFVLQQQALLEMNSTKGDLDLAAERLTAAQALRPKDKSLMHTRATLLLRRAQQAKDELVRKSLRSDARAITGQLRTEAFDPYVSSLRAQTAIDELTDVLRGMPTDEKVQENAHALRLIEDAEKATTEGLARAPEFQALLAASYKLKSLIGEVAAGERLLARALAAQPQLEYIAITYARAIRAKDLPTAIVAIQKALEHRPQSKVLNQVLFELLVEKSDDFRDELVVPLRRSFSDGDGNVLMHVHAVRFHFMRRNQHELERVLAACRNMVMPRHEREFARFPVKNAQSADGRFSGEVAMLGAAFGFIETPNLLDRVYFRSQLSISEESWDLLRGNTPIKYVLKFNTRGPVATEMDVQASASAVIGVPYGHPNP